MGETLGADVYKQLGHKLSEAHAHFAAFYPGESGQRQPVHSVYGGAHLFKRDTATKLGQLAQKSLQTYAPNPIAFARAVHLRGYESLPRHMDEQKRAWEAASTHAELLRAANPALWRAVRVYVRMLDKLEREPVEDYRIDFEDGFGNRPDAEEDAECERAARELAGALEQKVAPPFFGIRIKPLTQELWQRSLRTLDRFVTALHNHAGTIPDGFVVTLPKITDCDQVKVLVAALEHLEKGLGLEHKSLKLEFMIEATQTIFNANGQFVMPMLLKAADGRCVAAHFGTYDYTASCNITAQFQSMDHKACDAARQAMHMAFAGTGIWLSDGATNIMPVGPHKPREGTPLTPAQIVENREAVFAAWRLHMTHIQHSLQTGYFQGWDLHPAQLPTRYAAVYDFFLEGLPAASERLTNFVEQAAQATLVGDVFDDAATGQGLLNFFLRGVGCGALSEDEALATGMSLEEFRGRSFVAMLNKRRGG